MADVIRFMDGFDHYNPSSQTLLKWDGNFNAFPSAVTGRFSYGQAVRYAADMATYKDVTSSAAYRIGFALNVQTFPGSASTTDLVSMNEGFTNHIAIRIDNSGKLILARSGTQLGIGTNSLIQGNWYYLEMYGVITDTISSGHLTLKVNGVTEINVTSGDSKNGGSGVCDRIFLSGTNSWVLWYDDMVFTSMGTTTTPVFLGDRRIYTLHPDGNGNYSQFVGSDSNSVNNYLLVDDPTSIDTADYVESSTVSDRDSYTFENPALAPADVEAIQINVSCLKTDAGTKTFKPFVRISSTDYDQATISPGTSNLIQRTILETSPATAAAWTSSEINNLEAGVKIEA